MTLMKFLLANGFEIPKEILALYIGYKVNLVQENLPL